MSLNIPIVGHLWVDSCETCPFCASGVCTQTIDSSRHEQLPDPLPTSPPEFCAIQAGGLLVYHTEVRRQIAKEAIAKHPKPAINVDGQHACPHGGLLAMFCFNVWQETRCVCGAHLFINITGSPKLLCKPGCDCTLSYFDLPKRLRK